MDKSWPQHRTVIYKNHPFVTQCAFFAEMNSPSRKYMEDGWIVPDEKEIAKDDAFFVVLDGHGGIKVVDFCRAHLHDYFREIYKPWKSDIPNIFTKVFQKIDDQLFNSNIEDTGSTCCVCFIRYEKAKPICYLANMGDTKAVLVSHDKESGLKVASKTIEHKGTNLREQERVKQAGGTIIQNRVSGSLAVTRALGDLDLKKEGVINIPDVSCFQLNADDKYLILATDGLWDVVKDENLKTLIEDYQKKNYGLEKMTEELINHAKKEGTKDNTTVLIIQLAQAKN